MKAEIIAVGTELLLGHVVNTNAAEIARMLAELGIGVYHQTVVGDNRNRLRDAVTTASRRVELVLLCGGLGPTEDDLTRETVAEVLNLPLERDEGWVRHLEELFEKRKWGRSPKSTVAGSDAAAGVRPKESALPQNNLRQAMVPAGATLLPNSRGTAPGIYLKRDGAIFVLVPGPPGEMRSLMREQVLPRLAGALSVDDRDAVLESRVLRVIGLGESRVAEMLHDILENQTNPTIAPLAHTGEMTLRITAHAPDTPHAIELIDRVALQIRAILGNAVYGEDDETLESVVGRLLAEKRLSVATAESCTGGLLADRITNVPRSSTYFVGGIIAYSNAIKRRNLQVDPALIARDGAVSESVALAMARNVAVKLDSDIGIAITGIAGPDGGSDAKPVGLTWVAVHFADPGAPLGRSLAREYHFHGDRREVKERAAHAALALLREELQI